MSQITNLILTFSITEEGTEDEEGFEIINNINDYFENKGTYGFVNKWLPSDSYGGTKYLEAPIFIGVFDDLNLKEFVDYLKQLPWDEPEHVQVIVKEQEDLRFRIIQMFS